MAVNIKLARVEDKLQGEAAKRPGVIVVDHCVDNASLQRALGNRADVYSSGVRLAAELIGLCHMESQWVVVAENVLDRCAIAGNPLISAWESSLAGVLVVSSQITAAAQTHLLGYGIRDIVIGDSEDKERTALRVGLLVSSYIDDLQQKHAARHRSLLYRSAFDHSGDGLWVVDEQHQFVLVNEAFAQRRGAVSDDLIGRSVGAIGDEKVQALQRQIFEQTDQGDMGPFTLSRSDSMGDRLDVEVHCSHLDIEGERYLAGVVREVTDRNQAHEQLAQQLERVKQLLATSTAQSENLDQQVKKFLRLGLNWFDAEDGMVMLINGDDLEIKFAVGEHENLLLGLSAPKKTSKGYEFIDTASASAVENVSASGIDKGGKAIPEEVESFIGAPIIVNGQEFGALVFSSNSPRRGKYSESHLLVAELAAEWLAHEFYSEQIERTAAKNEHQLRMITDAAQEGIYSVGIEGEITFVNPAAEKMLGFSRSELLGGNSHLLFHHSYADGTEYPYENCQIRDAASSGGAVAIGDEVFWRKDGSSFPVEYSVALLDDNAGAVVLFRDVTQQKEALGKLKETRNELLRANQQLAELATRDPLTRIANRRAFDQGLAEEISRASRYQTQQPISLILVDVDYFKAYNDHYGHLQGDNCLVQVARLLKGVARRPADLVARYGGEEFVLLLPLVELEDAIKVAESARTVVAEAKIEHAKSKVGNFLSISCGVATMKVEELHALGHSELIRRSDQALYQAKAAGRNRVEFGAKNHD